MFEITGDHISELSDEDLRSLIGMLCEAEMRRRGLPVSAVTWGGNQNAKDAGLDVRVSLPSATIIDGFIPRPSTGYQVKKSDMPRSAIIEEMRPKGGIRPSIAALAEESGAYIVVSADGSTSDSALKDRRTAMTEAVEGIPHADKLALDFLDRGRLATWVRDHAGIIPWVRKKIGKAIPGWHPYGAWSHAPDSNHPDYLVDDAARIRTGTQDEGDGLSAIDGINRIRDVLRTPRHVVRLVGLSGVGKTRLLEALFDDKIGTNALDPALAAYSDVSDTPDPQPPGLAADLLAERRRMILVIDNCPPELHHKLSEIVRVTGSTLSVITVEYDIREDQPEGTDVFSLEASSNELIETLVARRFPQLSQVDRQTIAEFSGGNARIAIALAGTVEKDETIAGLSDANLLVRLIQQRHPLDESLLLIAQACALVYSFQGHDLEGESAELPILGGLIGKSVDQMYMGVAELRRRDLLQQRGVWRAVLPHAIANRLAAMALQNIPPQRIEAAIIKGTSQRLLRSFSRRLGYLDTSKEARAIVAAWLAPGGLLSDVLNLPEPGNAIFHNVAPVMPDLVLAKLESAIAEADSAMLERSKDFISLIRSLAFDPEFFDRATTLLMRFHALEAERSSVDGDAGRVIISFCQIHLSGTHATFEQRLALIEKLLRSPEAKQQALGAEALEAMLKTDHFSSSYLFEFGARSRDHGYYPKSDADIARWFGSTLKLAEAIGTGDLPVADQVKRAVAGEFRGLWANTQLCDDVDRMARAFAGNGFWRDGWAAARQTRAYDGKHLSPDSLARLNDLEEFLRPKDLTAKVRGIVLEATGTGLSYDEIDDADDLDTYDFEAAEKRTAAAIEQLGRDMAADTDSFHEILPELLSGGGRLYPFGAALPQGAEQPRAVWDALVGQLAAHSAGNPAIMGGFLDGLQKERPEEVDALLDDALTNPALATCFPYLQASVVIGAKGIARLHRSLELGQSPIERYSHLAFGRASDPIPGPAFRDLVVAICEKGGIDSVLHMVSMRLVSERTAKRSPEPETLEAGRHVLSMFDLGISKRQVQHEDHELGSIAQTCLAGTEGEAVARRLIRMLKEASTDYTLRAHDYDDLVKALFAVHPIASLDEMFTGDEASVKTAVRFAEKLTRRRAGPLDRVPPETLIGWCNIDPIKRYPLLATTGSFFKNEKEASPRQWTPLVPLLLKSAPNPTSMLPIIVQRLYPTSWGGSWATEMESRFRLLEQLDVGDNAELQKPKSEALARMRKQIEDARVKEVEEDKQRNARFE